MKILVAGDLVVTQSHSLLDKKLISLFQDSDFNIVNLEAPITDTNVKILKTGPHLKSDSKLTLNVLNNLNINLVTLANNHIKDYGEKGVLDTIDWCNLNNIETVGAGKNIEAASEPKVISTSEGSIAIINIAENEWSSAGENSAGANGIDLIKNYNSIKEAKKKYDFVIVIVHGGLEYYNLPSPKVQERYRFYVDSGSDLVIGHHTHCMSGYENYKGSVIYYSLGNFLFTKQSKHESWYNGIVLEVIFKNGNIHVNPHPINQSYNFELKLLRDEEKEKVLMELVKYSSIINDSNKLKKEWDSLIDSKTYQYINYWSPTSFIKSRYIKGLLSRLNINLSNKQGLALYLNLMRCETHNEISKKVIEKKLGR